MTSASNRGWAAASLDSASRRVAVGGVDSSSTVIIRATRSTASCRICSAWSACAATVSRVTSAVTKGLPSRSPPTHDPNRTMGGSGRECGSSPPSATSTARWKRGTACTSDWRKTVSTVFTSSAGVGRVIRSVDVRCRMSMSSSIRRRAWARSEGPVSGSSCASRLSAIRRSAEATARRRASVGCAVSTGWIRIRSIRARASGPEAATAGPMSPVSALPPNSPSSRRSERARWRSSARLVRCRCTVSSRAIRSVVSGSSSATSAVDASVSSARQRASSSSVISSRSARPDSTTTCRCRDVRRDRSSSMLAMRSSLGSRGAVSSRSFAPR